MAIPKTGKIIIYSLLGIIAVILAIFLTDLFTSTGTISYQSAGKTEIIVVLILSSLFLIGSFYLGFLFVRTLLKFIGNLSGFSGNNIPIRIVSLGFIALLFPNVIRAVIIAPIRFFINLVTYYINSLGTAFSNFGSNFNNLDFAQLIQIMLFALRDTWKLLSNAAMQFFSELQIPNLVLAIALWVIIGQVLTLIFTKQTEQQESRKTLANFFQNISSNTQKNIIVTIIFLMSAYLIMVSIIAVPWLQQTSSVFQENWEKEFDDLAGTEEDFLVNYGDEFAVSPLDTLSDAFLENQSALDSLPQWKRLISQVKLDRYEMAQQRATSVEQWKIARNEIWKVKQKLLNSAKQNLSLSTRTLGPLDQAYYYQELHRWLGDNINGLDMQLKRYQSFLHYYDSELDKWVKQIVSALQDDLEMLKSLPSRNPQDLSGVYFTTTSVYNPSGGMSQAISAFASETKPTSPGSIPTPPQPGTQWGIFGLISGWLLRANSYALILIIGMLGFGLFGSMISSVVREYSQRQQGQPIVSDITSAVIRGLSAAVVVFLSVKGGLAVFTTEDVEPNAYVLFFTCLVGAVFSEKIWEWAQEKLGEKFPTGHQASEGETEPVEQENDTSENEEIPKG